eukprot:TRINITY_DN16325_c0_g1_i1.p1 TRINITY_DN16325_c0_g1~~TRINITY_DN16325_c0_g1_i1.p1  ORF type:complete len:875 (-),score=128.48 TRINITY_DN16325_c0_g1_i1:78-2657(-)
MNGREKDILTEEESTLRTSLLSSVHYDLFFSLERGSEEYLCQAIINFTHNRPSVGIDLDFYSPNVRSIEINDRILRESEYKLSKSRLELSGTLLDHKNTVIVVYKNKFDRTGEGFHRFVDPNISNNTIPHEYVYTNFCPFEAHRVFPCFDQPNIKATFNLTVEAPKEWVVISNSPIQHVEEIREGNVTTRFEGTPLLSTYFFTLIAGSFHFFESDYVSNGRTIPLRIYSRAVLSHAVDTEEMFTLLCSGLQFYENFFEYQYPFEKYDLIFCPEFNWGGMENAAAVILAENNLFTAHTTERDKVQRANVLLHEMSHMWFGDLVTPVWWDGLWLNESFATFMASVAVQYCCPKWERSTWIFFNSRYKVGAYTDDDLSTTHPVQRKVRNTDEAFLNFDNITYGKGASTLKQLASVLGLETFRQGMVRYFKKHAFQNATFVDLLEALNSTFVEKEEVSLPNLDLYDWAHKWLRTCGTNSLHVEFSTDFSSSNGGKSIPMDGGRVRFRSLKILQTSSDRHPVLRHHHVEVAVFTYEDDELKLHGPFPLTVLPQPVTEFNWEIFGTFPAVPAFIFPNYNDLDYVKIILDNDSIQFLRDHLHVFKDPFLRQLLWQTLSSMTNNADMSSRDFLELCWLQLDTESDLVLLQSVLNTVVHCIYYYVPSEFYYHESDKFFSFAWDCFMKPHISFQEKVLWAKAMISFTASESNFKRLLQLLDRNRSSEFGNFVPDQSMRWNILRKGFNHLTSVPLSTEFESLYRTEASTDHIESSTRMMAIFRAACADREGKQAIWYSLLDSQTSTGHTIQIAEMEGLRQGKYTSVQLLNDLYFEHVTQIFNLKDRKTGITRSLPPLLFFFFIPTHGLWP